MAKVLVVDDDEAIRGLVEMVLDPHEVTLAPDGPSALELIDSQAFDVAILDVMMPEMDGLEVLRRLRRHRERHSTAAIMLTAKVSEDDHLKAFTSGADAYITKPFEPDDLIALVDEILSKSQDERREDRERERAKASLLRQLERRFAD